MPADKWTAEEMDTLFKALVSVPLEAKRAIASEVRKQCLGAGYNQELAQSILRKLDYDNLKSQG